MITNTAVYRRNAFVFSKGNRRSGTVTSPSLNSTTSAKGALYFS